MRLFHSCQIFVKRTSLQQLATLGRSRSFLSSSSARQFSIAWSSAEDVERLPNEDTPWLILNPETDEATGDLFERFYSPGENRFVKINRRKYLKASNSAKCVASTLGGWLGYVDPNNCSVLLSNPYVNEVVQLPSLTTLPSVVDYKRDPKTGVVFGLKKAIFGYRNRDRFTWLEPKYSNNKKTITGFFTSMALSSTESVVLAIQGSPKRLAYCPMSKAFNQTSDGNNDEAGFNTDSVPCSEWLGLQEDYDPGFSYRKIVYSNTNNLFYTIFANTGIQAYDLENDRKQRSKIVMDFPMNLIMAYLKKDAEEHKNPKLEAVDEYHHAKFFYLVSFSSGDLLLLQRHVQQFKLLYPDEDEVAPYKTLHFDGFWVDFEKGELEKMDDLGNFSLFVGKNQCFSMSVDNVPGIRPNCIYFSDDLYSDFYRNWGYDHGIFDLSDGQVLPLGYEEEHEKVPFSEHYSQFWVAPRLLFN